VHPFDQKKLSSQDFFCLSCVYFLHQSIFNSKSLGAQSGILHSVWEGGAMALPRGDVSCCLVEAALRLGWQQPSRSANELRFQNFLTMLVKKHWKQGPWGQCKFVHKPNQEMSPSNVFVIGKLEAVWCVNETCRVTHRESGVLICSSKVTTYCLRWN
jgi:hypothetical protein